MSNTNGKSNAELLAEKLAAVANMTDDELAASVDGLAEAAYEDRDAASERAAARRAARYRSN